MVSAEQLLKRLSSTPRPEFTTVRIEVRKVLRATIRTVVNSGLGVMSVRNQDTYGCAVARGHKSDLAEGLMPLDRLTKMLLELVELFMQH